MAQTNRSHLDKTKNAPVIQNMRFEQALNELETIVNSLETGKMDLEEAVLAYERGMALKAHCETKLQEAQLKVTEIEQQKAPTRTQKDSPSEA